MNDKNIIDDISSSTSSVSVHNEGFNYNMTTSNSGTSSESSSLTLDPSSQNLNCCSDGQIVAPLDQESIDPLSPVIPSSASASEHSAAGGNRAFDQRHHFNVDTPSVLSGPDFVQRSGGEVIELNL